MKTFEERYTEWIDGQLAGADLSAFEAELGRRAAVGEAKADRTQAVILRNLLRDHLRAPALSNAEFFSHQLRERIEAERARERRDEKAASGGRSPGWFGWSLPRGAWLGATALFVAAALYYGTMAPTDHEKRPEIVKTSPHLPAPAPALAANSPAPRETAPAPAPPNLMVKNETPPSPDIQAHVPDESTSATQFSYKVPNKDENVQVLWLNGLDYLPDVPAESSAPPAPVPAVPLDSAP
jgi:hypothetical protein